jgi:23S rRNA pseudouridine2605 synthase
MIRLNRYIAACTKYSRRQADGFIRRGEVNINGTIITKLATLVSPGDIVSLQGAVLTPLQKVYYILNKPKGYICSVNDEYAEHLITELVPPTPPVYTVGRLDKETSGLILLTNDGDLTLRMTHPSYQKEKEYLVYLDKDLKIKDQEKLLNGFVLDNQRMIFDSIKKIAKQEYSVVLHQGYNRQIRKMFNSLGYNIFDLVRVRIDKFVLRDLPSGDFLSLSATDIYKYFD